MYGRTPSPKFASIPRRNNQSLTALFLSWNARFLSSGLKCICLFCVLAFLYLSLFIPQIKHRTESSSLSAVSIPDKPLPEILKAPEAIKTPKSRYAFATYLSSSVNKGHYFIATRILAYQLLYAPETRSSTPIPFLVLVPPNVPERKCERLRRDGATVVEVQPLSADWMVVENKNWEDLLIKLRIHEFTDYERIAFLDADTVLNGPLDGLFEDPAVALQNTKGNISAIRDDEGPLPSSYVFAGTHEMSREHHYPPISQANGDYLKDGYLNAGFFVTQPNRELFEYYMSIIQIPNRFDSRLPEQNLLNYAHRREGNMPWTALRSTWNIHYPTIVDLENGCVSLHEKWWAPLDVRLKPCLESWRWRMEGFFQAVDLLS